LRTMMGLCLIIGFIAGYYYWMDIPTVRSGSETSASITDGEATLDDGLRDQVAHIVRVVRLAAQENALRPVESSSEDQKRLDGDALGDYYIRVAALAALENNPVDPVKAFLVSLGFALDPKSRVARHPVVRLLLPKVETERERTERRLFLGKPTLRGRKDLLLHFSVSASLVAILGKSVSEAVGIQKELSDAKEKERGEGTGFSFVDLTADYSGIEFAERLSNADPKIAHHAITQLAQRFSGKDFIPSIEGIPESLTYSRFVELYGSVIDNRFAVWVRMIRKQIRNCRGFDLFSHVNDH